MDKVFNFLTVLINVVICVFVTVDMYNSKKGLDEMKTEFKKFHEISSAFDKNLSDMNTELKEIRKSYKTFENFPPTITELEKR